MKPIKAADKCSLSSKCGESLSSWVFLFIGLIATIAIRLVNFILDVNLIWAKVMWYVGIAGFTIYFINQFWQYTEFQKELKKNKLMEKLTCRDKLSGREYGMIKDILCQLGSRNTAINYFFIFVTSAIALLAGIFQDFIAR